MEIIIASAEKTTNLQNIIGEKLFHMLNITRIYTKEPGKEPNKNPMIAHNGITVAELAKMIHNDFYIHFKYARIWGPAAKFPSEKVGLDRHLIDGTIIEIRV